MRLLMAASTVEAARAAARRAPALEPLLTPATFELVKRVTAVADHGAGRSPEAWAAAFDAAARVSPDGACALYALDDRELLRAATAEVTARLRDLGLLGPARRVLEIGCGSGRFVRALAPLTAGVVGIDVSSRMCAEAARRCAGRTDALVVRTGGRDLAAFPDAVFELVLAVDSFPYLVDADLAQTHLAEAARVLTHGGDLVILNWAYDGGVPPARVAGLRRVETDLSGFRLWDGSGVRFQKTRVGGA
jgi:SAM-dependent methyltransferase